MIGDEAIQHLLDTSAEHGLPFNAHLEHQGSASWLFVFSGPRKARNGFLRDLQSLGPFEPFAGTAKSSMADLLAQSVKARCPVLMAGDAGQRGTLMIGFSGDAKRAAEYVATADSATHGAAQAVHAQAVQLKTDIEPGP